MTTKPPLESPLVFVKQALSEYAAMLKPALSYPFAKHADAMLERLMEKPEVIPPAALVEEACSRCHGTGQYMGDWCSDCGGQGAS